KSKPALQFTEDAETIVPPGLITKSLPFAASELHFIPLLKRTVICVPSQFAVAEETSGGNGSVITAVPPEKVREYPCCELLQLLTINKYSCPAIRFGIS